MVQSVNMSKATKGGYMPDGYRRASHMISIDEDVWLALGDQARKMGLSTSRLIEIMAKAQIASQDQTVLDVLKGMMKDFANSDKTLSIQERMAMEDLIDKK